MKNVEEWMAELAKQYMAGKTKQIWTQDLLNDFKSTIEEIQDDAYKDGQKDCGCLYPD